MLISAQTHPSCPLVLLESSTKVWRLWRQRWYQQEEWSPQSTESKICFLSLPCAWVELFSSYRFLSEQKIVNDKEKIFPWCHNHLDVICSSAWSPLKLKPRSRSTLFSIDLTISDPRDQDWLYAGLISLTPGPEIRGGEGRGSVISLVGGWDHITLAVTGGTLAMGGLVSAQEETPEAWQLLCPPWPLSSLQHNTIWDTGPGRHKRRAAARAAEKINESWGWGGGGGCGEAGSARHWGPCHRSLSFARGKAAHSAQKIIFPSFFFSLTEDVGCQRKHNKDISTN